MNEESSVFRERVNEALKFLTRKIGAPPEMVIISGTGLTSLAEQLTDRVLIPYRRIPGFPEPTVESHSGNLLCGNMAGKRVAILQGRCHYYEGYSTREITLPLRVLSQLGAGSLMVTNAAGGLNPGFKTGGLMIIRDHLNFIPDNPLRGANLDEWGPRFPDLSTAYDRELFEMAAQSAKGLGLADIYSGVYCAISGPSLETPAETRYLRSCGADAVGMSTVPEVIVARHAGMRVLGISLIANLNDPDNFKPIIQQEVLDSVARASGKLAALLREIIGRT